MRPASCPGCVERDQVIAALQQRVADLEARLRDLEDQLRRNAANSSVPPSANPPQAPKPVVKQPTGKKPGGQPGHPHHPRVRLPADRVCRTVVHRPTACERCQQPLPVEPGPQDPEPTWHQIVDLPEVSAFAIEHQGHARTCPCCGHLTWATIPAEVRQTATGPNLAAAVAYLTGCLHLSKRAAQEAVEDLFGAPLALGSVTALEQEMSAGLQPVYAEAAAAAQAAPVKNVDETSWKRAGHKCWLWAVVTNVVLFFTIHRSRGDAGLRALLGDDRGGIIGSDRWVVYDQFDAYRRQLCWAHLLRDFQAMAEREGASRRLGNDLLLFAEDVFHWWYRVRDGTLARSTLRRYIDAQRPWLRQRWEAGARLANAKTAAVCRNLLAWEPALWTFVRVEGVEPTNNAAERALRTAVLWRKRSFGCHSEAGCRFVERMLTVVQTLRQQGRQVLGFLKQTVLAHRQGQAAPQVVLEG
jgi:transposase